MLHSLASLDALMLCACAAMILSTVAFVPYVRDTWRGQTRPQRSSWLIWSALSAIALASQIAEGASLSLGFAAAQCGGTVLVFLLAIRRGMGAYLRGRDGYVLAAAAMGLTLWYMTNEPSYALMITISVSLLGGAVTVLKAYANPASETVSCWALGLIAGIAAAISVGQLDWVLLAYPLYICTIDGAIMVAVWAGRRRDAGTVEPSTTVWTQPQPSHA